MKQRKVGAFLALLCMMLLAIMACNRKPIPPDVGQGKVALTAQFEPETDVAQVTFFVTPCGDAGAGSTVAVPVVGYAAGGGVAFEDPFDAGSSHEFAQAVLSLEPGCYLVRAEPQQGDGTPSMDCLPSSEEQLIITAGKAQEIVLVSQCPEGGLGAGDFALAANHAPQLELQSGTTTTSQCEELAVCVQIAEPNSDPVSVVWTALDAPAEVISQDESPVNTTGGVVQHCALLASPDAGQFSFEVIVKDLLANGDPVESVLDGVQSRATHTFDLHVVMGACGDAGTDAGSPEPSPPYAPEGIWTMAGNGPQRQARTEAIGPIDFSTLAGTADLPFKVSGALVVDDDGVIYVPYGEDSSNDGYVAAFTYDGAAFTLLWQTANLGQDVRGSLAVDGSQVYAQTVSVGAVQPKLHALDKTSGAVVWQSVLSSAGLLSPILTNEKVYVSRGEIEAYGLDGSGPVTFSDCPNYGEIAVDATGAVYAGCTGKVQAVDFSGVPSITWEYNLPTDHVGQTILLDNAGSLFVTSYKTPFSNPNQVSMIRLNTEGNEIWKQDITVKNFLGRMSLTSSGILVVSDDGGVLRGFNASDGTAAWSPFSTGSFVFSRDIVVDPAGTGYVGLADSSLKIFDANTGTNIDTHVAGSFNLERGSFAVLPDGTLITTHVAAAGGGLQGRLYAFKP